MTEIHTHGRSPKPLATDHRRKNVEAGLPTCSILFAWHCGRDGCIHQTMDDAQIHIDIDRNSLNERSK